MRKIGYMMTRRFNKRTTFQGTRIVERPGSVPNGVEAIDIYFEPMKVSFVDEDIDMTAALNSRWIVKSSIEMDEDGNIIRPGDAVEKDAEETEKAEISSEEFERVKAFLMGRHSADSEEDSDDVEVDVNHEDDGIEEDAVEEDVVDDSVEPEEEADEDLDDDEEVIDGYAELEDGRFECLICKADGEEKILKTESGMLRHLEKGHE